MAKQKKNPVTTNANGRELAPRANRGELQVTLGRGNVLIRNPHSSKPFFEKDFSGFHQGTGPMVANPGKYKKGKKKSNPDFIMVEIDLDKFTKTGRTIRVKGAKSLRGAALDALRLLRQKDKAWEIGPEFFKVNVLTKKGGDKIWQVEKAPKKKSNPDGDHNLRRPRPYQGVVDAVTDSVESRFSAPGREIIPGGQNRGELQLTSGRGNLVMRNPHSTEPFFEDDNSGFFQTEKDGKYSVLANPSPVKRTKRLPNGISIRLRQGKGVTGKKIWWVDYRLKTWKRGVSALVWGPGTKDVAIGILNGLSRHVEDRSQKGAVIALTDFAIESRLPPTPRKRNPSNEFIFERDLSGFYQGTGPRVANPKNHKKKRANGSRGGTSRYEMERPSRL